MEERPGAFVFDIGTADTQTLTWAFAVGLLRADS
jgi:hypothetical protein